MLQRIPVSALLVFGAWVVASGALVSSQGQDLPFSVHPSTQEPGRLVTLDKLKQWEKELSNWGRWGKDDQRGLLNLITPEKTKQAIALVKEGKTVTLQINPIKKTGQRHGRLRRERSPDGSHRSEDRRHPGRARHHPAVDP